MQNDMSGNSRHDGEKMDTKKYIIEIPDNTAWLQWVNVTDKEGNICFDYKYPENLTPYTEPDIEQVRKEAYQKGLNDAWDAARWLSRTNVCVNLEVFNMSFTSEIVHKISASEAIEKIRQYEQKKQEEEDSKTRIEYNFDIIKGIIKTTAKEYSMSIEEIAEVLRKMQEEES